MDKLNLTLEQVETIRSLRREEYDDDMLTADWLTLHAEVEKQAERLDEANAVIGLLLDNIDYTNGACGLAEPIGGILPRAILDRAKQWKEEQK